MYMVNIRITFNKFNYIRATSTYHVYIIVRTDKTTFSENCLNPKKFIVTFCTNLSFLITILHYDICPSVTIMHL